MKVIRSKTLGYCMGVHRAVNLAAAEAARVKECGRKVYTIGPLIHNFEALSSLELAGIEVLKEKQIPLIISNGYSSEDAQDGSFSLVIRAHGIDPKEERSYRKTGANIIDATCPNVKKSQLKAKALAEAGYSLFIAGDAQHAEINGIYGYAKEGNESSFCRVVSDSIEAREAAMELFNADKNAKTALVGQTTISEDEYDNIGTAIIEYFPNLEIVSSVCASTKQRQKDLQKLLEAVDAVIIAGSKESANTRRLLAIAKEGKKPCAIVENALDIPEFFHSFSTVGLSAGASTPESVVDEIELELLR